MATNKLRLLKLPAMFLVFLVVILTIIYFGGQYFFLKKLKNYMVVRLRIRWMKLILVMRRVGLMIECQFVLLAKG